jgi:hypothetical protein
MLAPVSCGVCAVCKVSSGDVKAEESDEGPPTPVQKVQQVIPTAAHQLGMAKTMEQMFRQNAFQLPPQYVQVPGPDGSIMLMPMMIPPFMMRPGEGAAWPPRMLAQNCDASPQALSPQAMQPQAMQQQAMMFYCGTIFLVQLSFSLHFSLLLKPFCTCVYVVSLYS